jgi:preprotein translocase subunit YajC
MPPIILLLLSLVIFASAFGYMMFRREADKRSIEKKRNQYNDRA